jgi:fumarate reductase flavoprotein subunit
MNETEKGQKKFSRREFLKGAGVSVATVAGGSILAACSPKQVTPTTSGQTGNPNGQGDWKTPPAPIPDSQISKTVDVDVVVVGGGVAGLIATCSASDAGAKVAMLEKWTTGRFGGAYYGAMDSKLMREQGRKIDKTEVLVDFIKENQDNIDASLISTWLYNSGEAMDWLMEKTDAAGLVTIIVDTDGSTKKPEGYDPALNIFDEGVYPGHRVGWDKNNPTLDVNSAVLDVLKASATKNGVNLNYETPAKQLIKNSAGRVVGVIATDKDGKYIKFNATKAVILCTGDYMGDLNMVNEYIPWVAEFAKTYAYAMLMNPVPPTPLDTGDGHKMAMWAGAAMQGFGHGVMLGGGGFLFGPFTRVNSDGQRFMNENTSGPAGGVQVLSQKGAMAWEVFDSKYAEDIDRIPVIAYNGLQHLSDADKANVEKISLKADTLEALADLMEVPKDTFVATINRRNELAKNGEDVDFGVVASRMVTVDTPPYYAVKGNFGLLLGFGGILVNNKLQALNENHEVVPGLYIAGNTSGRRFSNYYYTPVSGATNGMAMTHGYLAGKNAAAEKV